jgi:uncharacterized protein YdcH (DUF465 family)
MYVLNIYLNVSDAMEILSRSENPDDKLFMEKNNLSNKIKTYNENENTGGNIKIVELATSPQWVKNGYNDCKYPKIDFGENNIPIWPKTSNLNCWHCTRNLSDKTIGDRKFKPISIPYKKKSIYKKFDSSVYKREIYNYLKEENNQINSNNLKYIYEKYTSKRTFIFYSIGCFCSFQCAMAWIKYEKYLALNLNLSIFDMKLFLYELYRFFYKSSDKIIPAPPKEYLINYGGIMSNIEYDDLLFSNETISYKYSYPPIISLSPMINFQNIQKINTINSDCKISKKSKKYRIFRKNKLYNSNTDFVVIHRKGKNII